MKALRKPPYYIVRKGLVYLYPRKKLRDMGFAPVSLGPDGEDAKKLGWETHAQWSRVEGSRIKTRSGPIHRSGIGIVYFVEAVGTNRVKIGWTTDLPSRLRGIDTYCPFETRLLNAVDGEMSHERSVHSRFRHLRIRGEWFRLDETLRTYIAELETKSEVSQLTGFKNTPSLEGAEPQELLHLKTDIIGKYTEL